MSIQKLKSDPIRSPTVFVPGPNGERIPRIIETGLDNNRMVHVTSGLEPGERVLLTPPLELAERPSGRARETPRDETENGASPAETTSGAPDAQGQTRRDGGDRRGSSAAGD